MTDPSTDSTVPVPIVMSQPDPAPFWDLGVVAAAAAARVRSVNGHGARANARDACRQLAPARQHSLALAWQTDHPSAIPPCRHVRGLHECGLSRRIRGAARYSGRELARVVGWIGGQSTASAAGRLHVPACGTSSPSSRSGSRRLTERSPLRAVRLGVAP